MDATFILRLPTSGDGVRLAVKDLLDVAGTITTAGSRAVARDAQPAATDAACLRGARAAGARIVGKTNLHELAYGADGINTTYGTPVNPLDPGRVPGGSSSGSAVAVATDEADVAFGTDTGGSVRIPAACCGIVGLKTTYGRIPTLGCWPLAPSLDTIGPMAATVAGIRSGMDLLEPGFSARVATTPLPAVIGRYRPHGDVPTDPAIDHAVDEALALAEIPVIDVDIPGWAAARDAALTILLAEAWECNRHLLDHASDLTPGMAERIALGAKVSEQQLHDARALKAAFLHELHELFIRIDVLATPTLGSFAPRLDRAVNASLTAFTRAANIAGTPALALPVPASGSTLPASVQLMGLAGHEERLVRLAETIEGALR